MVRIKSIYLNPLYLLALIVIQAFILLILIMTWPPSPPVTLRFLVPSSSLIDWNSIKKEFEAKNPDIRLDIREGEATSNELEGSYSNVLTTATPYDLVYMDIIWVPKFAANGWLMNLFDQISDQELSEFSPSDLEGGKFQNQLYRIPFHSDVGLLYYRQDILEQLGYNPPKTFQDLLQISQNLKQEKLTFGNYIYIWQGWKYEGLVAMFLEVLQGYGGFWIEHGEVGLDRPEALQAIKFLRSTIERGISPEIAMFSSDKEYSDAFTKGEAIFLRSWPYVWTEANAKNSPIAGKIGFTAMVASNGKSVACRGGWGFGIARATQHPKQAWRAIQFLTSEDAQRKFLLEKGYLPSRISLLKNPKIQNDERYKPFIKMVDIVEQSISRPSIPEYRKASDILQNHLMEALNLNRKKTPEEVMKAAAAETRKLLKNQG
jgi:multiple sugar transport system substrate-binding protein